MEATELIEATEATEAIEATEATEATEAIASSSSNSTERDLGGCCSSRRPYIYIYIYMLTRPLVLQCMANCHCLNNK